MFPSVDEQKRAFDEWCRKAVTRWAKQQIRPICNLPFDEALAYVKRGQDGELPLEEAQQIWEDAFVAALREWPGAMGFFRDGGVPGCRVPESTDFRAMARTFRDGRTFYQRWLLSAVIADAVRTAESLREADDSYNPDY